jgi:hypothetical protein
MLEKLNSEQEKLMYKHRDEYIDFIINNYKYSNSGDKNLQIKDIEDDIEWIYSKIEMDKPKFILFADSYYEEKLMINHILKHGFYSEYLVDQVIDQVNDQVIDQVWNQVRRQASGQVRSQVWNQVSDQVRNQISEQGRGQVSDQVSDQVRDQVNEKVIDHMWILVRDKMRNQIRSQIRDQVWDQVIGQMRIQVSDQVRDRMSSQIRDQVCRQIYYQIKAQLKQNLTSKGGEKEEIKMEFIEQDFGICYDSWISFYKYFEKIDILKNDDFSRFSKFILKGIWSIQFFKNWCIITRMPLRIQRDDQNRLHSVDGSSIIWNNKQDKNYFIHGVSFSEELWEKVVTDKITVNEILNIQNMEQRNAILSVISPKILIDNLGAKLISTHKQKKTGREYMDLNSYNKLKHHEIKLYRINGKFLNLDEEDVYILFYVDPSTTREYFSFIDPKYTKDAVEAMASKFGLTKQEYLSITAES